MLTKISIAKRIWSLSIITAVAFIANSAYEAFQQKDLLMVQRSAEISSMVDAAYSVIKRGHDLATSGKLSEAEAKALVKAEVTALRYRGNNYFWLNGTDKIVLAHGASEKLVGKSAANVTDKNGKRVYIEFIKVAQTQGQGYVDYVWPKANSDVAEPKLAYVKLFEPWNWIVGTGVYTDDIDREFYAFLEAQAIKTLAIISILVLISFLIARSIITPLKTTTLAMQEIAQGDGDLTVRLDDTRKDELGELASGFNGFVDKVHGIVAQMKDHGMTLQDATQQMALISTESKELMSSHQEETHQVATATHQMNATIIEVARNAADAAKSVQTVQQRTLSGKSVVEANIEQIGELARFVDEVVNSMDILNSDAKNIGAILDVIKGIAEQTNLLALNAAIEAARAGEQGRGFAVVADEVRTLAMRTQESAQEIEKMIGGLQVGVNSAVQSIEQGRAKADASVGSAAQTGESLNAITEDVIQVADMNTQIASATEEQSAVVETVSKNIENINQAFVQAAKGADDIANAGDQLQGLANEMSQQLAQFKV